MKPDVIVSWPRNCDYPLWRQFIRDNRDRFNVVIIVFTETNQGLDYREFIRRAMESDYVYFIDNRQYSAEEDWRNVAIHAGLLHSYNAQWIWFTEQDFIVEDPKVFWREVELAKHNAADVIAVYDGPRMHPCCIFIERFVLNKTTKDFSARPPKYDHFGSIQRSIEEQHFVIEKLQSGYTHLNGLSHNMTLLALREAPNYKPEEFKRWLRACLEVTSVPLDDRFVSLANYGQLNNG